MNQFVLALAQMPVVAGQPRENLHRATGYIARAEEAGASVVLLPETLDCGWCHDGARWHAGAIPDGQACEHLRETARKHRIHVCAGLVERAGDDFFNSAILVSPAGEILLQHRKLHELEMAHPLYAQGDRLGVARTELGTFGLMICADAFARGQVVSRTLGLMGAQIILSPCAWAVPPDHDNTRAPYGQLWLENYRPVAKDFRMWIAGVSNVGWVGGGEWSGHQCIGCSLVMDSSGEPVLRGPYGADAAALLTIEVTLAPRPARGDGWEKLWT